ncbi:trypsin-like cysteine/serine peptidase domain-containing protein [Pilobolus umbonatus]|nr:trypsin-like cysteine/serine peptidase domain-containing protein [Pilobolus umbonatus]
MKRLVFILLFSSVYGIKNGKTVTDISDYPFYIMISNPHLCGGTLLSYNPAYVLTAAHCIESNTSNSTYAVHYGHAEREYQIRTPILDWKIHPNYRSSGKINEKYDVAIVQLKYPLKKSQYVRRVPLWSSPLPQPIQGELIGFGYTGSSLIEAPTLQSLTLNITKLSSDKIEGIAKEGSVACHGDSGSPLMVRQSILSSGEWVNVPYVIGTLARIYGVRDINASTLTCPIPIAQMQVTQSFCNVNTILNWISVQTRLSLEELTSPELEDWSIGGNYLYHLQSSHASTLIVSLSLLWVGLVYLLL